MNHAPVIKGVWEFLRLTVVNCDTQSTVTTPPKSASHVVSYTVGVFLSGGAKILTVRVVGEGASPNAVFDCHAINITYKPPLVKGFF